MSHQCRVSQQGYFLRTSTPLMLGAALCPLATHLGIWITPRYLGLTSFFNPPLPLPTQALVPCPLTGGFPHLLIFTERSIQGYKHNRQGRLMVYNFKFLALQEVLR